MARQDDRQNQMPARQQPGQGRITRSPYGWGGEGDFWGGSPFHMMRRMQEDMDRVFASFFGQPWSGAGGGIQAPTGWAPSVDLHETENEIIVRAEIPGVEPEDLEVYATEDALVLRGETRRQDERQEGTVHRTERRYGRFERQIPLPPGTRPDDAQANFRNGILELRIPKTEEARQRVRRIPIGGAAGAKGGETAAEPPQQGAAEQ